jgi:hypothetical protein
VQDDLNSDRAVIGVVTDNGVKYLRAPRFIPVNRQPPARVHEGRHFVIESAFTSFTRHEVVEEHWSHLGDP